MLVITGVNIELDSHITHSKYLQIILHSRSRYYIVKIDISLSCYGHYILGLYKDRITEWYWNLVVCIYIVLVGAPG